MKQRRHFFTLLAIIVMTAVLFGCSTPGDSPAEKNSNIALPEQTGYPFTLIDDTGTSVVIPAKPARIVSLLPSSTEILSALGQEPIAVTQWDDFPAGITERVEFVFQDALNPNLEQLVSLKPDLIMYWLTNEENTQKIRNLGVPVVVFDDKNIAETYETIALMGGILARQEQADQLINRMKAKERDIDEKLAALPPTEKRSVWLEADDNLYTTGRGTFLDELITRAGGLNIAGDAEGWVKFNSEQVIARDPDVILETYSYSDQKAIENIKNRRGWENIQAIRNNRVMSLDNSIISRQGPRIIDGLELVAKAIYPELFIEK